MGSNSSPGKPMGIRTSSMAITTSTVSKLSKPRSFAKCALSVIYRIEERQVRFWGCRWGRMSPSRRQS